MIDQVSDKVSKSFKALDGASEFGYESEVAFVDRAPKDAWREGVVTRAVNGRKRGGIGRTVPLDIAVKGNIEARKAALELLQSRPDANVSIIDNNNGMGLAELIEDRDEAIAFLSAGADKYNFEELREELANGTERLSQRGLIPRDITAGLLPGAAASYGRVQLGSTGGGDPERGDAQRQAVSGVSGTQDQAAGDGATDTGSGGQPPAAGTAGVMKAADLKRDPSRFQYKMNTNPDGVTGQFKDVKFNPELAGRLAVWQDPQSGETYVVNGHHRHELAERSGFDGGVSVYHMSAANEQEARAKGALMNIAGGNGTAVDAGRSGHDHKDRSGPGRGGFLHEHIRRRRVEPDRRHRK